MSYQVSEFEQKHINKIKNELEKFPNINTIEKAYYIYYRMCQFYIKNYDFYYGYSREYVEEQYTKQTEEDRKATCYQENATIAEAMKQMGINAGYLKSDFQHHVDGYFMLDKYNIYFFNASADLSRSKTGRIIRGFGLEFETLASNREAEYVEYIGNYFADMEINVELAKNRKILEKDIKDMNGKLDLDFHGITLDDFIRKLIYITSDEKYMIKKFGTKDKGRQIEMLIDIINTHKVPNDAEFETDYTTGSYNYVNIFSIFPKKNVEIFDGMEFAEKAGKERKIFFVKQEGNLVAYEFDTETQKLKKQNVDELAKQNILDIHIFGEGTEANKEKRTISYAIYRMQKECEVPEH